MWMTRFGLGVRASMAIGLALAALSPAAAQDFVSPAYSFLKAVKDRDGDKVTEALSKPGNTMLSARDDNGDTALHIVAKRKDLPWLQFLLSKGAPMDARDRQGNTPMIDAAQIGFSDGISQLLQVGAQPNLANNKGETALIIATEQHDLASVNSLVQYGADPNIPDHVAGMSAMDYAKRDGRSAAILKTLQVAKPQVTKKVSGPSLN
jgi:uncharacterized protein